MTRTARQGNAADLLVNGSFALRLRLHRLAHQRRMPGGLQRLLLDQSASSRQRAGVQLARQR